jgi:hypothetical protein
MMKTKSTIVDIKIAGAVAGKLVNAKVRREVERALEAYPWPAVSAGFLARERGA